MNISNLKQNLRKNHASKELVKRFLVINDLLQCTIDARLYMGRAKNSSTVYCDLWIHGNSQYGSGNGQAGGYGYDKQSAALYDAVRSAGIVCTDTHNAEALLLSIACALDNKRIYKVF